MRTTLTIFFLFLLVLVVAAFGAVAPVRVATFHVKPSVTVTSDGATLEWETTEPVALRVSYWVRPRQVYGFTEPESTTHHEIVLAGLEPGTIYSYQLSIAGRLSPVYQFQTSPRLVAFHVEPSMLLPFVRSPVLSVVQPIAFHVEPYLQLPTPDGMTIMWETTAALPSQVEFGPTPELGSVLNDNRNVRLHQIRLTSLRPGTRYYYRVRSAELVSRTTSFRTAPPPGTGKWRLAVYGDSRSNPAIHRKVVEQIAMHDVDLILHTGDIVLDGRNYELWRREFFAPLAPIAGRVPWLTTIGNHERDSANYFS